MNEQKRQAPRVPIEIRVEYRRLNAFIADFTRDLSGKGLFIRSDRPLEVGTECLFTLTIPKLDSAISLRGVVRRSIPPGEGEEEAGMGIELLFDDEAERAALDTVLDDLMFEHLGGALFDKLQKMRNRQAP